jgi:hypothetical protein
LPVFSNTGKSFLPERGVETAASHDAVDGVVLSSPPSPFYLYLLRFTFGSAFRAKCR